MSTKQIFGLIGNPLSHSFSKKYFNEKFSREGITHCSYELFELSRIEDFNELIKNDPRIQGLNVTIPYKEQIIPFLDDLHESAKKVKAVNVIKFSANGFLRGYNSDYFGFMESLVNWLPADLNNHRALILGTGGAAKAVQAVLNDLNISHHMVSRNRGKADFTYRDINQREEILATHNIIINTTPVGAHPNTDVCPEINYDSISANHYVYDLIYNPSETLMLIKSKEKGAIIKNGMEMLELQAEKAWEIWNT